MAKTKDLIIEGLALRGLVRGAEAPVSGELVKRQLFQDLELDLVAEYDFRAEGEPGIVTLPVLAEGQE